MGFIEKRKEHRLPFGNRIVFTDGDLAMTALSANISRGGIFAKTLDPHPIDTVGIVLFPLPNKPNIMAIKAKVVHIVIDRQKCEIECGMGLTFMELTDDQRQSLDIYVQQEKNRYSDLKQILISPEVSLNQLQDRLKPFPELSQLDLLGLRYRVNRICTIFESPTIGDLASGLSAEQKISA